MNRNILIVIAMLLAIALLAGILMLVGLSQKPQIPGEPAISTPSGQTQSPGTSPGTETIPGTDTVPGTDTEPTGTTGPLTPPDYVIPEAFKDIAVLNGDTVTMTMGGYSVTFPTDYRLTDVGGKPSLIAPDGSSARLETAIPPRDVDALDDDNKYMASVISQITSAVPTAKLVSATDMVVATLYDTRVGMFTFTLKLGDTEINYKHVCFSDQTRFHTVLLSLIDGTPYTFEEILDTLTKLEEEPPQTDSPIIKPPVTRPPVQTDPPSAETDPPGVILPPDDFDDPFDDNPDGEYQIPDMFKPFTVVEGDTVKMAFGGYRVSFPTTYQLLSIGGMPALQAPDGSLATLSAKPSTGTVYDLTAEQGVVLLKEAVAEKGGVNPDIVEDADPVLLPYNGIDFALYFCNYEKAGIEHELTHVIFYSDGMEYTVSMGQVVGSEYSFMDLLYSVEKI